MDTTAYIDWNIFNKIEKLADLNPDEKDIYTSIKTRIDEKKIVVPYSNAHMNDLARGYAKNPDYTEKHLETLTQLTENLCIVQYWGKPKVTWHYRDPQEFLDSTIKESDAVSKSFSELFDIDDDPLIKVYGQLQNSLLRMQPLEESFKEIYKWDPIFNLLFPRSKTEMNKLALAEDLYQFSIRIKTDYVLYKHFQKFLNKIRLKFPQYQKQLIKSQAIIGKPEYLNWDKMVDNTAQQVATKSFNAAYDRIMNLFTTTDMKGYNADERFANMIDDGLHCFYAAHCDYFISIDKRCLNKSKKVYETLKISTLALTPEELVELK